MEFDTQEFITNEELADYLQQLVPLPYNPPLPPPEPFTASVPPNHHLTQLLHFLRVHYEQYVLLFPFFPVPLFFQSSTPIYRELFMFAVADTRTWAQTTHEHLCLFLINSPRINISA